MFTEEGRYKGTMISALADKLYDLTEDEIDEVWFYVNKLITKRKK